MKKIILFAAILFSAVSVIKADAPVAPAAPAANDNVTLNVKLYAIQTLVVNPQQKIINLEYKDVADYKDGVKSLQEDHLTIYSTGGFGVTVNTGTTAINGKNGKGTITSSTITVTASEGTSNKLAAFYNTISLNTASSANLITSNAGGVDKNFNITYAGIGNDGYVNSYYKGEGPTVYETIITYTIAAK